MHMFAQRTRDISTSLEFTTGFLQFLGSTFKQTLRKCDYGFRSSKPILALVWYRGWVVGELKHLAEPTCSECIDVQTEGEHIIP